MMAQEHVGQRSTRPMAMSDRYPHGYPHHAGHDVYARATEWREYGGFHGIMAESLPCAGGVEVWAGIEPTYADLQSAASPFCHQTSAALALYLPKCASGQAVVCRWGVVSV